MKKLLTLGLALASVLTLAGCSSSTPTDEAVAPVVEVATGVVEAPVIETPVVEAATGVVEAPVVETPVVEAATGN